MPLKRSAPVILLVLVALVAAACGPSGDAGPAGGTSAEGAVAVTSSAEPIPPLFDADAHVAAWVDLWATYDLARVDDLFLSGPDTTYFSSEKEGLIIGFDAVREHHAGFGFVEGGGAPTQELWVDEVDARAFGSTVVVNAIWYFGDRAEAAAAQKGPMTSVWVLDGDTYKIAHMHFAEYLPVG